MRGMFAKEDGSCVLGDCCRGRLPLFLVPLASGGMTPARFSAEAPTVESGEKVGPGQCTTDSAPGSVMWRPLYLAFIQKVPLPVLMRPSRQCSR